MWPYIEHTISSYAQAAANEPWPANAFDSVVIRRARDDDAPLLAALAQVDSAKPLTGPALLAVINDEPAAALSLEDGRTVADPFRPTAAAVALLRMRARQLEQPQTPPRRGLRPRWIADRARA